MELRLNSTDYDENYAVPSGTRLTTNFANLAKEEIGRSERIKATLAWIHERFHELLGCSHDPKRYRLRLEVLTIEIRFLECGGDWFPMTEMLRCRIHDSVNGADLEGPTGFGYSSYVRDYDFNILLPAIREGHASEEEKEAFGNLHGLLFRQQFSRNNGSGVLHEPVVIAISVANGREYRRNGKIHPILGWQYECVGEESMSTKYFSKMGLTVAYHMPPGCRAPLAFYHQRDDLQQRSPEYLAALVSVMDAFERIYRPEIYSARVPASGVFRPDLSNADFDPPLAVYDRVERDTKLGMEQALRARDSFLEPNKSCLRALLLSRAGL